MARAAAAVWRRLTVLLAVCCLQGLFVPAEQHATVRHGFAPSILHVEPDVEATRRAPRTLTLTMADLDGGENGDPEAAALLGRSGFLRDQLRRVRRDAPPNGGTAGQNKNASTAAAAAATSVGGNTTTTTATVATVPAKNSVSSEFASSPIIKAKFLRREASLDKMVASVDEPHGLSFVIL